MSKNARVLRNIFALLVSQAGTWSATFILTLVVPPYLGARYYGLYSFVATYTSFFGIGIVLGTGTFLTWRIARDPSGASHLLVNTLALQVPLWMFWTIVALAVMPLMDGSPLTRTLTIFSLISVLFISLSGTCISALSGLQIMRVPAFIGVATALAGAIGAVALVHLHVSIVAFVILGAVCQAGNLVSILIYTHRKIPLRSRFSVTVWPKIVAGGMPFFIWSAVLLFYWQVDIIMLKVMVGDAVIGWYSVANRIISIPGFLPSIVVTAILPALSRERTADSPHFRALASRAIRLVTAVNIPASIGVIMLSSHMTTLLHFPGAFGQIGPLIVILSINMPLVALDMVLGTVLISVGRQGAWTWVGVIAGILNPLVNLWAIPFTQHMFGDGAIGAALTTIQSELIMLCGAIYLRPKNIFTRWDIFYILRCMVAAAIMVPAVAVFANSSSTMSLLLSVCYGVLIYGLACYALQVITTNDIRGAATMVSAKLGFGNLSREQLGDISGRLGLVSAQVHVRDGLVWVRASVSRPIHSVSRPLAKGREVVSQPLKRAFVSIDTAASRYWNPTTWLEHERGHAPLSGGHLGPEAPNNVHELAESSAEGIQPDMHKAMQEAALAAAPLSPLAAPSNGIPASSTDLFSGGGEASSVGSSTDGLDSQLPVEPESNCAFDGYDAGSLSRMQVSSVAVPNGV